MTDIHFRPIDLSRDFQTCHDFRRDSYVCSFGTDDGYAQSVIGYQERMQQRLDQPGWFYIHLWQGEQIIGQLEFRAFSDVAGYGYVHLIYLIPACRGRGIADLAQTFIANTLKHQGCKGALLSVSRTNTRAVKHYQRWGWRYLKPNPKHATTDFYRREFAAE
ncbi:GNAT family N-acetyltransferase [Photobacterium sp. MCCC 1A19761]|uniref:GNAT family N-acetyltransferase n=1 Tax=Photobacterium sp. MCCC 1A19761 TaxID=3115000 RepID=UPI00307D9D46